MYGESVSCDQLEQFPKLWDNIEKKHRESIYLIEIWFQVEIDGSFKSINFYVNSQLPVGKPTETPR